jgi:peptide deformylase
MTNPVVERAADAFAAALRDWRVRRGLSKKQLAAEMGFDPSYVSHVEARRHRPTEDFARRADTVLAAGGEIVRLFREYDEARHGTRAVVSPRPPRDQGVPEQWLPHTAGLLVEHEQARLSYHDGQYRCVVRRDLYNAGAEPVTRYLVRISVDRYPGEPERSNRHYRDHPLTWTELNLDARCEDESMHWRPKQDRDSFKEIWLLFENDNARFPLYPGQRATIEYAYSVGEDKWGHWFQRAVRLPTRCLSVRLDFPAETRPVVWGVETSLTAEAGPLRTPMTESRDGDRIVFDWTTNNPPLNARYRLEWRFRANPATSASRRRAERRPSDLMTEIGIVQRGAPVLERPARWFDLPDQAALAQDVVTRLLDTLDRVSAVHEFGKGMGLAAPQLGIGWAAAVVRAPAGHPGEPGPVVLLNPRIVGESVDRDDQYEGCLSFFDVRGLVPRPLVIELEHADLSGARTVTTFTKGMARLIAHEVDHLGGLLYSDRMPTDGQLIPVEQYDEQGRPWQY